MLLANIFQENLPKKIYNNTVLSDVNLLSIDNYTKLQTYLEKTSLIVNDKDKDIGEKLRIFIENKVNINVELNNNYRPNQIILDYNKDEDSYKFSYFIKDKNYNLPIYPFKNYQLSASEAENLFISINPNDLIFFYWNNTELIQNFILYQALLSNFMISQKSDITKKKNLRIQFGFNSYPPSIEINNKSFLNIVIIYINFGFYYASLFFVFQLSTERQLKINIMLNGVGISKTTNFFSWIAIYFIINSFVFLITYIGLSFILKYSHFLLFLTFFYL